MIGDGHNIPDVITRADRNVSCVWAIVHYHEAAG